jgi:hypothetical protein
MKYIAVFLLLATAVVAQNPPSTNKRSHLDIPTIAQEANGKVVLIVMSDKDGHPIAQGSGFLISKDGHVVTNYHVIKNGPSAVIKFPNGAFFAVEGVLASDKDRDIAVIKVEGNDFRMLTLGDSARLRVGEEVVAIGNPLSLESTVSNGIVSGFRTVEEKGGKFLQITAPISPGSSGGPLFNMAGQVVGITTSYLRNGENLNFAIPINAVKPMLLGEFSKVRSLPDEADPVTAEPTTGGSLASLSETETWLNQILSFSNADRSQAWMVEDDHYDMAEYVLEVHACKSVVTKWVMKVFGNTFYRYTFEFGVMDPTSIKYTVLPNPWWFGDEAKSGPAVAAQLDIRTRDDADVITVDAYDGMKKGPIEHYTHKVNHAHLMISPDYAPRVVKGFRHAVELCGGKSSAF